MKYRLGELFSGPGGMALGAFRAAEKVPGIELEHAWANDFDSDSCETYVANIPGASPTSVYLSDVSALAIPQLSEIEGFAYGFPCNDFSAVGKSKGVDGKFGPLYSYGIDVLNEKNPQWFVAENVSGLSSSTHSDAFGIILQQMREAGRSGYRVTTHKYSFDDYGVPQKRRRVVIVGIREDLGLEFRVPSPSLYKHENVSAGHALLNPPITEEMEHHTFTRQSQVVVERLKHIRPGENAFNARLPHSLRLNVKGATLSSIYRRLKEDSPSYTITGSGGGGTHGYHWSEPRALTNRERARLQTFPDDFFFTGSPGSIRKQIGMAVPVKGAEAIFLALFRTLALESYPAIAANISASGKATPK